MGWLEDVLAQLQGGAGPAAYGPAASPFPDPVKPMTAEEEAALAAGAREAAGRRMIRANQRRMDPFGVPDIGSAGIQLALGDSPAGTGVPGPLGEPPITPAERAMMPSARGAILAGPPDGSVFGGVPDLGQFAPMSIGLPPSVQAAKAMTAPPPPPPGPTPVPAAAGGVEAGGAAPLAAAAPAATDVSAQRRAAPMGMAPMMPAELPQRPFAERLAALGPGLVAMGAILSGEGSGASERMEARRQALEEQAQTRNITARALLARGAPAEEVAAAIRSPDMLKALVGKYFETKPAQNVNGRLVREMPDGTVRTIADFSEPKAPTQREVKLPDGSVQQQEWDKAAGTWRDVGKPAPGERDRRMSITDVTKLSEEGAKVDQIRRFNTTFQPGYAGWKVNAVGELANTAGRNLPEGVVGKERADASQWWQDYDSYKNQVRHGLYGASLTKNEQGAFLRADIHPGMDPVQIQRNLARQQRLIENSIRRKGNALIGSTYDKGAVSKAFGVDPNFFDQADEPVDEPKARRSGAVDVGGKKVQWSLN